MQHLDLPINCLADDELNFGYFASKVAQGILNYSQQETLVFSIEGAWGSGKTSLISLIENEIRADVEILHFNPWLVTDINQVTKLFFDELIKTISRINFEAKCQEEIKQDMIKFVSFITPEALNIDLHFIKFGYKPKNTLFPEKKENLEILKKKINTYLGQLKKKIIIIVDDIDRLTDTETEFIFRLTKGIADFDNLIYILLYDKSVVSKSLQTFKSENGEKYLEKIVQYSLSVPKPHVSTIKRLLFKKLDEVIEADLKNKFLFQEERWSNVASVLDKYIKTIRDINQIIGIMSFEYPIICEDVNFVDFFIVSLIKLKNHELHEHIIHNQKDFFIDPNNILMDKNAELKRIQENFDKNLMKFHSFKDLLYIAFPALLKDRYSNKEYVINDHINKYICDIYYFENYFSFSMSDDKLTIQEYYEIEKVFVKNDFLTFKESMLSIEACNKSDIFLDMFLQLKLDQLTDKEEIENCFRNILQVREYFQLEKQIVTFTSIPIKIRCVYVSYAIIKQHPLLGEYILNLIEHDTEFDLRTKIYLVKDLLQKSQQSHSETKISDELLSSIKTSSRNKLEAITLDVIILDPQMFYLIGDFDFFGASTQNLSNELLSYIFESPSNFFTILKSFIEIHNISSSSEGRYTKYIISRDNLSKLIELAIVEDYIKKLDTKLLDEEQNNLLKYWNDQSRW